MSVHDKEAWGGGVYQLGISLSDNCASAAVAKRVAKIADFIAINL